MGVRISCCPSSFLREGVFVLVDLPFKEEFDRISHRRMVIDDFDGFTLFADRARLDEVTTSVAKVLNSILLRNKIP